MTQENKELLLRDLSARLPYGVMARCEKEEDSNIAKCVCMHINQEAVYTYKEVKGGNVTSLIPIEEVKVYLRPMSSMTEEERVELREFCGTQPKLIHDIGVAGQIHSPGVIDFLNSHHFDYRGLIEKGIAIAVTEENNLYK